MKRKNGEYLFSKNGEVDKFQPGSKSSEKLELTKLKSETQVENFDKKWRKPKRFIKISQDEKNNSGFHYQVNWSPKSEIRNQKYLTDELSFSDNCKRKYLKNT